MAQYNAADSQGWKEPCITVSKRRTMLVERNNRVQGWEGPWIPRLVFASYGTINRTPMLHSAKE